MGYRKKHPSAVLAARHHPHISAVLAARQHPDIQEMQPQKLPVQLKLQLPEPQSKPQEHTVSGDGETVLTLAFAFATYFVVVFDPAWILIKKNNVTKAKIRQCFNMILLF